MPWHRFSSSGFANSQFTRKAIVVALGHIAMSFTTGWLVQTAHALEDTPEAPVSLPVIKVTAAAVPLSSGSQAVIKSFAGSHASISAAQIDTTVNVLNIEDSIKYQPNILVRKRFTGDTNAPVATRTTGVNASARSLIYADHILLSTLINNNNGNGSPQWFLVAPDEVARIDILYGPFSAAFPGNSYGAVTHIKTRMPEHLETGGSIRTGQQKFRQYGTDDSYPSYEGSVWLGDRINRTAFWLSFNYLDSWSQPVTYGLVNQSTTKAAASLPVITGAFAEYNRTNQPIQLVGAGNLTHTRQSALKLKLAHEFTDHLSASYVIGYWNNHADLTAQSYLTDASGQPYYGSSTAKAQVNIGGYAYDATSSGIGGQFTRGSVVQGHLAQSLALKGDALSFGKRLWGWELAGSDFRFVSDEARRSSGNYAIAAQGNGAGTITDMHGTSWYTLDAMLNEQRPDATGLSAGLHQDTFRLKTPVYNTSNWQYGNEGSLASNSLGRTQTDAIWVQEVWRPVKPVKLTGGLRYERWKAYDGYNMNTDRNGKVYSVQQPEQKDSGWSPKLGIEWQFRPLWKMNLAAGRALRFPTVGELYQNVATGATYLQANPDLKPESVVSEELSLTRAFASGQAKLGVFNEDVRDALISQTALISGYSLPVSYVTNVGHTRQTGLELGAEKTGIPFLSALELAGNITWVHARILENDAYQPPAIMPNATSVGKVTPYIPKWRVTATASYPFTTKLKGTLGARYSSSQFATVDNTDTNHATYMGFQSFTVFDARLNYLLTPRWSIAAGVDNLNNKKYFLYHPFPQRTLFAELKFRY